MSFRADLLSCLAFWSRLPARGLDKPTEFGLAIRALPVAALIIAAPAVVALAFGVAFGLSSAVAALVAVAALAATTGALHEDGLADCADAIAGGTPERRLEIMKDSRIGAFGALALIFSVGLRTLAIADLTRASLFLACMGLFAAAAVSRTACLSPLVLLPPARDDGLGRSATKLDAAALRIAIVSALVSAILPLLAGASAGRAVLAAMAAVGASLATSAAARRLFGGQTGDVAGAAQQLAEIAYLVVLSTAVSA